MKAEHRWSRDSEWLLGRALVEGLAMEVRGVNEEGCIRFSSDQRSLESRAAICSQREEKHCRFASELTFFHAARASWRWWRAAASPGRV
jgi:hypothetical protein